MLATGACAMLLGAALLFTRSAALAQSNTGQERPSGRGQRELPDVEASMKAVERSLEKLTPQVSDAARLDENLRLIGEAQRACAAAKMQAVPKEALPKAADAAAREKATGEYRRELLAVMRKLLDVELALLDGNGAGAAALLKEIQAQREAAHTRLGIKD